MAAIVLDSHALIAYFRGEDSALAVKELLRKAAATARHLHMTEVNYAEVKYMLIKKDGAEAWEEAAKTLQSLPIDFHPTTRAMKTLQSLPIDFHPTTRAMADLAADFKARFKMSLADAFAAALAKEKKAELVTGDTEFQALQKEIKINWLK